ncbi:hypothetical protein CP8484711_0659, partial [Chlamydia psittaci 84-8471/1]
MGTFTNPPKDSGTLVRNSSREKLEATISSRK